MNDFTFYNPTEIIYGKNKINIVGEKIKEWTKTKNILLVISKSCQQNGILDNVLKQLKKLDIHYFIVDGIVPNPNINCINTAKKIIVENNIDFILAIGGASTVDTAKTISVAAANLEDIWDLICSSNKIKKSLPLGVIITLYGSGTEMTNGAVISNLDIPKKRGFDSKYMFPKFSIMDPNTLDSVNKEYLMIGATDMFIHALETYFEITSNDNLSDPYLELLLRQMINEFKKFKNNNQSNANLFWLSTLAQNKFLSFGKQNNGEWVAHIISHEFCLKYNFPHGRVVSVLFLAWLNFIKNINAKRIIKFGKNVLNLENPSVIDVIQKIKEILVMLGNKTNLKDMGVKLEDLADLINNSLMGKTIGIYKKLSKKDINEIVLGGFYGY